MKRLLVIASAVCLACGPSQANREELARWKRHAANVTIIRDDWGIPHIYGRTDADAVFGTIYAQAEDDFNRIERNYLVALGRLAEAEGPKALYQDLRARLFANPDTLRALYATSPAWLKALMDAWADGLNYYLATHPEVRPKVLRRFEPWMALSFTEGSIGGDIERIDLAQLAAFYSDSQPASRGGTAGQAAPRGRAAATSPAVELAAPDPAGEPSEPAEPGGSNGLAIAPANTRSGHALLWINPHTTFFFRAELQMASEEGLNAYGAVTWGQFFVYQGFNQRLGWMHTSSGVDAIDEYREAVVKRPEAYYYRYGNEWQKVRAAPIVLAYRTDSGLVRRQFTGYWTHHGPIVRRDPSGAWVSVRLMWDPVKALTQSYTRTKAKNYQEFRQILELHTNSSNNTVYADADGNIAYFHANFIPKRDPRFDWSRPVDGSITATEWQGVLPVDQSPNVLNPPNGWIQNTNNAPWSVAGPYSPKKSDYPAYVETGGENPRGLHAIGVLEGRKDFTLESLIAAGFDSYLPAFEPLVPALVAAYDRAPQSDPLKARLREPIALLRTWDLRWGVNSIPTSLAVFWGEELWQRYSPAARNAGVSIYDYLARRLAPRPRREALAAAVARLEREFGTWKTPWGEINRFQRLTGDLEQPFDDRQPSTPVGFTSARWGSLAAFAARPYPGTKRWYGTSGNSFVAAVEFGDSVRAKAVTAGGASGDPRSPHFNDQAVRYSTGDLREVYFYRSQLRGHTEREYHPGAR